MYEVLDRRALLAIYEGAILVAMWLMYEMFIGFRSNRDCIDLQQGV